MPFRALSINCLLPRIPTLRIPDIGFPAHHSNRCDALRATHLWAEDGTNRWCSRSSPASWEMDFTRRMASYRKCLLGYKKQGSFFSSRKIWNGRGGRLFVFIICCLSFFILVVCRVRERLGLQTFENTTHWCIQSSVCCAWISSFLLSVCQIYSNSIGEWVFLLEHYLQSR